MKRTLKLLVLGALPPLLLLADLSPEAPLGLRFAREAAAIVGAPLTPVSAAGVARRTTRRVVVASSASASAANTQQQATAQQQSATAQQQAAPAQQQTPSAPPPAPPPANTAGAPPIGSIVPALPAGCVSSPKGGVEYYQCGGVYYRAAFQGNNLVYVVQQP